MNKFWSSAVARTEPYVPGEQIEQEGLLKLNTNENPYPPSPKVVAAIQDELGRKLHRYPTPSVDRLREKIAEFNQLNPEQVFVGNGSDEVLAFSFMAFFEPGKTIRFPAVSYSFYPVYAKLFDIPYEEVPLNRDFSLAWDKFFQSDGGVIFPNPNAPTSLYLDNKHIIDIIENNPNNVVIVDEAYIDFAKESAVHLVNNYENLLVVQTMSKSRSLAGLRIGFAVGNPNLIEALNRVKNSFNSYTLDRLAIAGAEAAIMDVDYFHETTKKVIHTREWVTAELKKVGFTVLPSDTNFLFIRHYKINANEIYQMLKEQNILTRHFNRPSIESYLRITIGTDEDMTTLIDTLTLCLCQKNKASAN
ncbi:histidinol-phosphate transaminase [Virgibacillus phasianinus]|uniref:Histidinol-phosphate aminotransferase n=1 Tax=Virgibacillus phasianinus TaxID=2017483 RepID=A0A220U0G9_9BACI|nr:histidinol-phosphate transaminase [Virgibacillus phasianinus]ASK61423.1 histidinol-phosphate transaminase [Virgibacillus phasianinus]